MQRPRFWIILVVAGVLWYLYETHKDTLTGYYERSFGGLQRGGYFLLGAIVIYILFFNRDLFNLIFKRVAALDNDPRLSRVTVVNPGNDYRDPGTRTKHKRNVSALLKKKIAASQHWQCSSCHKMLDETYEVDHIIALDHGGTNDASNLRALCPHCHRKKTVDERIRY